MGMFDNKWHSMQTEDLRRQYNLLIDKLNGTPFLPSTGGYLAGHLLPSVDATYDLGATAYRWRDLYLSGTLNIGGTIRSDVAAGTYKNVLYGTIGGNDFYRIQAGGGSNAGALEIATADDGNEPIYIRQYTGEFGTVVRTLTLLDASGNSLFPGNIYEGGTALSSKYAAKSHSHSSLPYTGVGNNVFTTHQTDGAFYGTSGWGTYLIGNHGDGATYYHQMLKLSFFGPPSYHRMEGGSSKPWYELYSNENCSITGDDSNRSYRFPNGLQINVQHMWMSNFNVNVGWGTIYSSIDYAPPNFNRAFAATPVISMAVLASNAFLWIAYGTGASASRGPTFDLVRPTSMTAVSCNVEIIAIGRWY